MLADSTRPLLIFSSLLAVSAGTLAQSASSPLTVEAIFGHGSPTGAPPEHLTWSPDGKHLTYEDHGNLIDLAGLLQSGATEKTPQILVSHAALAKLEGGKDSEQDSDHRDRYGMADYIWSSDSSHLLFDFRGRLWLVDPATGKGVLVGNSGEASGDDPKFSPDGSSVSYLSHHSLVVQPIAQKAEKPIIVAPSNAATLLNGEVDWVYEEELGVRSNYFWSPDSKTLAFVQMDEAAVPEYPLTDWIPTHATVNNQRYPQPGDPNPAVRLGVVRAEGGKTVWINLPIRAGEDYIPRFGWADAKTVWVVTLTRDHKHMNLYFADAATGQAKPALQLTDSKFFDEHYHVSVADGTIVLTKWSDGHMHLYLYSYDKGTPGEAKLVRQLTKGDFEVTDVYQVDHKGGLISYASTEGNPLGQNLWQVRFDGEKKQLTSGPARHSGNFSPQGNAWTDNFSTRLQPPTVQLCQSSNCTIFWKSKSIEALSLRAPQTVSATAHDGTTLYGTLLLPEGVTSAASVPLILNPYGGPGVQTVNEGWSAALLFDTVLAQHGFAVLHTDNRGMGMRGREFAQATYQNFGPVQFEDQLTMLDSVLAKNPQLDPKRLGWWGWSWGGTFTLYAMSHSDRFRAGVSVAPVTDWHNYDSIYTERYMSLPSQFAEGYDKLSVVSSAANLKGHLLLVHGTGDDNVHMENSIQYVQKLIEAQVPYDLQLYPRKTHSISGPVARTHLYNRILTHFEQYLKPVQP